MSAPAAAADLAPRSRTWADSESPLCDGGFRSHRGSFAPAMAADVVSSNVVGYQKLTLKPGYNMIPNNFVTIGEDEEMFGINEMFDGDENATATRSTDTADRIDLWDASTQMYVSYFRMTNRQGTSKWWGRFDSTGTPTDDSFAQFGDGAFYLNQADSDLELTISGQVKSTSTDITFAPGYSILCNPYPMDIAMNDGVIDWSNAVASRTTDTADRIDLWDASTQMYVSYFRMTNRQGTSKWWGRYDSTGTATADVISSNQSFFYFSQANESWTATIPSPVASGN